jgi:hypothetical protein
MGVFFFFKAAITQGHIKFQILQPFDMDSHQWLSRKLLGLQAVAAPLTTPALKPPAS